MIKFTLLLIYAHHLPEWEKAAFSHSKVKKNVLRNFFFYCIEGQSDCVETIQLYELLIK